VRALAGGALAVLMPLAAAVSVTGSADPAQLVWVALPGALALPPLLVWQGWVLPRRQSLSPEPHRLVLTPRGLVLDVGGRAEPRPWATVERVVVGAGHMHLHVAGAVWHVPRHAIPDEELFLARIEAWRHRPDAADAPGRPAEGRWSVTGAVTTADWVRHRHSRAGWAAGLAARFAIWRDPDLWPCGLRTVVLGDEGGWVDDAAGPRTFAWDGVTVEESVGYLCLRVRASQPVLLRRSDLPSDALVADVTTWTRPEHTVRLVEHIGRGDPWAPPAEVSRSARWPHSHS
jgi:hypothetical protein